MTHNRPTRSRQRTAEARFSRVVARWPAAAELLRSATERNRKMTDYEIVETNAENIGRCSFCGYKDAHSLGHRRKTDWLKERYAEGLRFKVLRSRRFGDIGMIEYALGNHAWRPVEAEGYLVIHCLSASFTMGS